MIRQNVTAAGLRCDARKENPCRRFSKDGMLAGAVVHSRFGHAMDVAAQVATGMHDAQCATEKAHYVSSKEQLLV